MKTRACLLLTMPLMACFLPQTSSRALDETSSSNELSELDSISQKLTAQKYNLRYRYKPGETIRTKVVHQVSIKTTMQGTTQTAQTRAESTKAWKVTSVDKTGNITFVHSVENVDMMHQVTGRQKVSYNSLTDKEPPPDYQQAASSVGIPLVQVTIDPRGKVLQRKNQTKQQTSSEEQLLMPLPDGEVALGAKWSRAREVVVRLKDKRVKRVKTRELYQLKAVKTGIASIALKTQVLTPVNDPEVKSQLVQRLTSGTIKFDIEAGRVRAQQFDVDQTVIGFNGAESIMHYLGRFTEQLLPPVAKTAALPKRAATKPRQPDGPTLP